jgi:membrane fusion protein, heavy metal efflux system
MSLALLKNSGRPLREVLPWAALGVCLVVMAASLLLHDTLFHGKVLSATTASLTAASPSEPAPPSATTVTLTEGKWKTGGIRTAPARMAALPSEVGVPGWIEANPDHRVEIRPRASGVVREVKAALGQKVKKGDVLVILDSPDLGTARLNLRGRQIELATARVELDWKQRVAANVSRLIPQLRKGVPASTIQQEYADRPLGSNRALLIQAYSEYEIASHEDEKTSKLYRDKIVGEHPAFLAMHTREGAQARFEAQLEQVRFDAKHEQTLAEQKVQLAEAAVIDAAQRLRILGASADVAEQLALAVNVAATRASTGEDVMAYEIVAPFDGTIITRTVSPSQKAEANDVLFTLADLSTVWVMANVPESDFGVLPGLKEGLIRLTATAYPGRTFEAKLLSIGAMVDPKNPHDILKLGMFVRIALDTPNTHEALTVPAGAVVEIEGKDGVFVPAGKDGRTFAFRHIKAGREASGLRVINEGLAKGDTVVTAGAFFLKSELILQNETEED